MEKILLKIDGTGVVVEVIGASGEECLSFTQWMDSIRGAQILEQTMKVPVGEQDLPVGSII